MSEKQFPYEYRHPVCNKAGFYYDHKPEHGEMLLVSHAQLLDGSEPKAFEEPICGSCGEPIKQSHLKSIYMLLRPEFDKEAQSEGKEWGE